MLFFFFFSINNCTEGNTGVPIRLTLFVFSMVTNFQTVIASGSMTFTSIIHLDETMILSRQVSASIT